MWLSTASKLEPSRRIPLFFFCSLSLIVWILFGPGGSHHGENTVILLCHLNLPLYCSTFKSDWSMPSAWLSRLLAQYGTAKSSLTINEWSYGNGGRLFQSRSLWYSILYWALVLEARHMHLAEIWVSRATRQTAGWDDIDFNEQDKGTHEQVGHAWHEQYERSLQLNA